MTDPTLIIPDDIKKKHSALIPLIVRSESMNGEEKQYWINILPVMTPEQIEKLTKILQDERRQLDLIDAKYAKKIETIGQEEFIKKVEEEHRSRRQERSLAERAAETEEHHTEEDILQNIKNDQDQPR
ncbi:hypothetical protein HYZ98_00585 [Candidatus Peregrinibacteria bacterium]|nr:hypothetical protein [Candidatus Peregrinibacteria bacterium]